MSAELLGCMDWAESNRSRLISGAVRYELQRRQRLLLLRSLAVPQGDSGSTASLGPGA